MTVTKNKKAYFENTVLKNYTAGIQLFGSEVKSIRNNEVSINEAYCQIIDGEIFIKNMYIAEYAMSGKHYNHKPIRDRKLLLNKKEILYLKERVFKETLTIIPLSVFITANGLIKIDIGLAKGKKNWDKRQDLKSKDVERELTKIKIN